MKTLIVVALLFLSTVCFSQTKVLQKQTSYSNETNYLDVTIENVNYRLFRTYYGLFVVNLSIEKLQQLKLELEIEKLRLEISKLHAEQYERQKKEEKLKK